MRQQQINVIEYLIGGAIGQVQGCQVEAIKMSEILLARKRRICFCIYSVI